MIAMIRYTLAVMLHSQRYLPPALLFVISTGTFAHDAGIEPMLPIFAPMTAVAFVCAVWLTMALATAEDPIQRSITAVNAGRSWPQLAAVAAVVIATFSVLILVLLCLPFILGNRAYGAGEFLAGGFALVTAVAFGSALGLPTSRLVIRRQGYALVTTLVLLLVFLLVRGLPPVNTLVSLLSEDGAKAGNMLLPELALLVFALAMLAASVVGTQLVLTRRS